MLRIIKITLLTENQHRPLKRCTYNNILTLIWITEYESLHMHCVSRTFLNGVVYINVGRLQYFRIEYTTQINCTLNLTWSQKSINLRQIYCIYLRRIQHHHHRVDRPLNAQHHPTTEQDIIAITNAVYSYIVCAHCNGFVGFVSWIVFKWWRFNAPYIIFTDRVQK